MEKYRKQKCDECGFRIHISNPQGHIDAEGKCTLTITGQEKVEAIRGEDRYCLPLRCECGSLIGYFCDDCLHDLKGWLCDACSE